MKRLLSLVLAIALVTSLAGCTAKEVSAADRLAGLLDSLGRIPAGTVYFSGADPYGEEHVLDGELAELLWAREDGYCEYAACVEEAAVYLGGLDGCYLEATVFICYGSADTEAVAAMCLRRLHLLRSGIRLESGTAGVVTEGRCVILLATSDRELAERVKEILG